MSLFRKHEPEGGSQNPLMWIGGYCALPLAGIILSLVFLQACSTIKRDPPIEVWDDMKRQPKFKPQKENDLFADRRDSRTPPVGTIAHGHMTDDSPYFTGMNGDLYVGKSPVPVSMDLLKNGERKFNIYCSPCHDREGMGDGIVPHHVPTWQPANLTEDRIVQYPDGEIFDVMSNGRRSMPAYKYQVSVQDRWAIVAYLRVLQRAAHSTVEDVPADRRNQLQ